MPRTHRLAAAAAVLLAAGAAVVLAPGARAASLVTNGDFDNVGNAFVNNTGLGSDDLQTPGATSIPGWTSATGFANDFWTAPSNSYGLTASPGNGSGYFVDLTGQANNKPYGAIQQTISTVVGMTYDLTFDLGASTLYNGSGPAAAALTASATGAGLDGSQEFTLAPTGADQWQSESLSFMADSTSTTIEFLADSAFTSQYTGLDNVSVALASPGGGGGTGGGGSTGSTAVPEPASLALLAAGLLGLTMTRRKVT